MIANAPRPLDPRVFSGRTSAEHARLVLEGYAVHDWMVRNQPEFTALAAHTREKLVPLCMAPVPAGDTVSPFAARVIELGRTLKLAPLEQDILSFAFLTTISDELSGLFAQLARDLWTAGVLWPALFDAFADIDRPGLYFIAWRFGYRKTASLADGVHGRRSSVRVTHVLRGRRRVFAT